GVQVIGARRLAMSLLFQLSQLLHAVGADRGGSQVYLRILEPDERFPELYGCASGRGGRIVELVYDAGREGAERGQLLGLAELEVLFEVGRLKIAEPRPGGDEGQKDGVPD